MFSDRDSQPLLVVAGLIERAGRLLLAQRPAGKVRAGLWEFPGGKVEPGERPEEALERELREELGVWPRVEEFLAEVFHSYPEVTIRLQCFRVLLTGEPKPFEGQNISWFEPEGISFLPLAPADRRLWKLLRDRF